MHHLLALSLLAFIAIGCTAVRHHPDTDPMDLETRSPERRDVGYVDIDKDWRLESEALTVTRDQSQNQVLRAGAQLGARLTSIRLPHHTQVPTTVTADAIYYDAFQDRFECVGHPVVRQGASVIERPGSDGRVVMYSDGTIKRETVSSLVP